MQRLLYFGSNFTEFVLQCPIKDKFTLVMGKMAWAELGIPIGLLNIKMPSYQHIGVLIIKIRPSYLYNGNSHSCKDHIWSNDDLVSWHTYVTNIDELTSKLLGYNIEYPPDTHLRFKSREIPSVPDTHWFQIWYCRALCVILKQFNIGGLCMCNKSRAHEISGDFNVRWVSDRCFILQQLWTL